MLLSLIVFYWPLWVGMLAGLGLFDYVGRSVSVCLTVLFVNVWGIGQT